MHNLAVQEQSIPDGEQRLSFSATGSEYFRIWIVNLLLTIVTLGIYSAWAKVRRTQYFYGSTRLAGSSLEYHGNPIAILKGRIIAVVLIAAYQYAPQISLTAGIVAFAVFAAVMPLMVWKSMQFKLYNTSYRGIRFGFNGSVAKAYGYFLAFPLLFGTLILAPFAHHRIKRFQVTESRYGSRQFGFDAPVGGFYAIWVGMFVAWLVIAFGAGFLAVALGKSMGPQTMVWLPFLMALVMMAFAPLAFCLLQNLVWNHVTIGEHEFRSDMKVGKVIWIQLTNLLGIMLTVGLFTPFAQVRWTKYRLESMSLIVNGSLDEFVAGQAEYQDAAGEGVADIFDLDIAL